MVLWRHLSHSTFYVYTLTRCQQRMEGDTVTGDLSHQKLHCSRPVAVQRCHRPERQDAAVPRKAMTSELGLQGRAWDR